MCHKGPPLLLIFNLGIYDVTVRIARKMPENPADESQLLIFLWDFIVE